MGCSPAYSLGAALAACGVCSPLPPSRKWVRADQVDSSRAAPGSMVNVRLGGIPATDSMGRKAHVRAIALVAKVALVVAGAANTAVTAHTLRSIWQNIVLEDVTGHQYWPAIDGRVILDDHYFRFWRNFPHTFINQALGLQFGTQGQNRPTIGTDNGLAAAAGAATYQRNCSLYAPLARPLGIQGSPFHGLIPLAALQKKGADALRFRIATAFPTAPTDVAISALSRPDGTAGMEVWLEVVYLPGYAIDAPYTLDSYQLREQSGMLLHPEQTTEYAWIRYLAEDPSEGGFAGQLKASDHTGVTLNVAGFEEVGAYTQLDMGQRMLFEESEQADGALVHNNAAMYLPTVNSTGALALMLLGMRARDVAARGPINFKYVTRAATFTRYTHRVVECVSEDRAQKLADALDCDPCKVLGTDSKGNLIDPAKGGPIDGTQPVFVLPKNQTRFSRGYGV